MAALTASILAAFSIYVVAWYAELVEGNFSLLLFVATMVTGVYWIAERTYFLPHRRKAALALEERDAQRRSDLVQRGIVAVKVDLPQQKAQLLRQPWWLDWTAGLFPVICVVFLLRSFLFEPFKIPSGSMMPTLLVGDLILVNKFHYGVRLPVINTKLTQGKTPQRGDVIVFRYPPKPSLDYIKRVVGLPGDTVAYLDKRLTVNGQLIPVMPVREFFDEETMRYYQQAEEALGGKRHRLLYDAQKPAFVVGVEGFAAGLENCTYSIQGLTCKVPQGQYFMMGDNRDNSLDSRYWGFVPEENIVGKAFFVWMNFSNLKRIGAFD